MAKQPFEHHVKRSRERFPIDAHWDKPAYKGLGALIVGQHMGETPRHCPKVMAKLVWDDDSLYVIFRVEDRYVRAAARKYQDPVCRDSCVEFFFTPGSGLGLAYFNIEVNCGGTMLFWWHPQGSDAVPVAAEDANIIEIAHTLPKTVAPEVVEPVTWVVEYRLPFAVVRKYCAGASRPAPGVTWKANFYKCADASSHPHWLTWSFVDHPTPKFHLPQYFGALIFD